MVWLVRKRQQGFFENKTFLERERLIKDTLLLPSSIQGEFVTLEFLGDKHGHRVDLRYLPVLAGFCLAYLEQSPDRIASSIEGIDREQASLKALVESMPGQTSPDMVQGQQTPTRAMLETRTQPSQPGKTSARNNAYAFRRAHGR